MPLSDEQGITKEEEPEVGEELSFGVETAEEGGFFLEAGGRGELGGARGDLAGAVVGEAEGLPAAGGQVEHGGVVAVVGHERRVQRATAAEEVQGLFVPHRRGAHPRLRHARLLSVTSPYRPLPGHRTQAQRVRVRHQPQAETSAD
jgi:hypothetical protein